MTLSKSNIKFGIGLFLFCCFYWILDSIWSYLSFERNLSALIYREPMSYTDTLLLRVSPYQFVSRIMVIGIIIVTGILIAGFLSKRKKAEDTIREQWDFLNTLVETIPNPIFYKDREKKYSGCNSSFESFFGRIREEIIGKTVGDFVDAEFAALAAEFDEELCESPGTRHYESRVKRSDGHYRDVIFDEAPIVNKAAKVVGSIGVMSDITERKKAAEDKMRLEKQLQQSQRMETIGTLAGGIAHDFNNILYGTIGFAELCLDDATPGTAMYENLEEVLSGGKRAKALIEQILAFSRQTQQEMGPLQVGPIVREVSKLLRSIIPSTIEIQIDMKPETSAILGDATKIHQVILNLCTNAHHAMEKEGGTLRIDLSRVHTDVETVEPQPPHMPPGDYLRLSVSDTGQGIPPEIQDRIFDPFFTSKKQGKGTGMGLSVVHGIIQSHHGFIAMETFLGKGTRFDVYFPIIGDTEPAIEVESSNQLPRGSEHIFLIDDEAHVVKVQKLLLEKLNYTVTFSTNSVEALDLFKQDPNRYDAVITDMTMPKMTGEGVAFEIRKIKPDLPVIICTGYSEQLNNRNADALGVNAILMKPTSRADLATTLRQVLDKRSAPPIIADRCV